MTITSDAVARSRKRIGGAIIDPPADAGDY